MIDVILYDLDGAVCPPNLSAPVGGSEVELYQLHEAFNRAGLKCELITKRPDAFGGKLPVVDCRRLVYWRQVEEAPWCYSETEPVIRATDAKPDDFRAPHVTICVSQWQARAFKTPTIVIPPMLGAHVKRTWAPYPDPGSHWVYASAANKGVRETVQAWIKKPRGQVLYLMTTGYDFVPPDVMTDEAYAAGVVNLGKVAPRGMVDIMSACRGMFYRNCAPETFGVTTAIAVKLGLELDIECVGHEACGLAESRVPQDLSEETTVKRWVEALRL